MIPDAADVSAPVSGYSTCQIRFLDSKQTADSVLSVQERDEHLSIPERTKLRIQKAGLL